MGNLIGNAPKRRALLGFFFHGLKPVDKNGGPAFGRPPLPKRGLSDFHAQFGQIRALFAGRFAYAKSDCGQRACPQPDTPLPEGEISDLERHAPRRYHRYVATAPATQEISSEKNSASGEPLGQASLRVKAAQA